MAYQIHYDGGSIRSKAMSSNIWKYQLILSACLLLVILTAKWCMPKSVSILESYFLPSDLTAVQAMAQVLSQGGTLRQGMVIFCQTILKMYG